MWKRYSGHFRPGEGSIRGLLRDYEPSEGPFSSSSHHDHQTWCWWGTGEAGSVGSGHQAPHLPCSVPILNVAAAARTPCALWQQPVQTSSMWYLGLGSPCWMVTCMSQPTLTLVTLVSRASTVTHGSQLCITLTPNWNYILTLSVSFHEI